MYYCVGLCCVLLCSILVCSLNEFYSVFVVLQYIFFSIIFLCSGYSFFCFIIYSGWSIVTGHEALLIDLISLGSSVSRCLSQPNLKSFLQPAEIDERSSISVAVGCGVRLPQQQK